MSLHFANFTNLDVYWLATVTNPLSSSNYIPPAPADNHACHENIAVDAALLRLRLNPLPTVQANGQATDQSPAELVVDPSTTRPTPASLLAAGLLTPYGVWKHTYPCVCGMYHVL